MTLEGSNTFRIKRGNGLPSTNEKGGMPEDSRQKVKPMEAVMEMPIQSKGKREIPSSNSPDRNAAMWLNEQISLSQSGIITHVIDLTPPLARVLLARNPNNRKISEMIVENYARDMTNGAWAFNGEPIIVSGDGTLNDGQHRCEAVLSSGVTIPCVIVIGPDRSSRLTVDQGKMRMAGDYLGMNGHTDAVALAAAANYAWQHTNHGFISESPKFRPTKSEVLTFVSESSEIIESLSGIPSKGSYAVGGRSLLGFAHWAFVRTSGNKTSADLFMDALIKGSNLTPKSPILYARNRLMSERGRLKANEKAELIIRAWNCSRRGEKVASLPIKGGALPIVER
jgi:hypothetical protein